MKRLLILFIFLSETALAQVKWRYGLELDMNAAFGKTTYQRNVVYSANAFGMYRDHELYCGFDVIFISYYKYRTWGFESGYKYHLRLKGKRSNFMADLNYQYSRYCEGCVAAVRYNFKPETREDLCMAAYRVKSNLLSCGLGYELFYTKWLSSSFTVGPAVNWAQIGGPPPAVAEMEGISPSGIVRKDVVFNYFVKASVRITL